MSALRSPRTWLYAGGGWLILAGMAHAAGHVWTLLLGNGLVGQRELAANLMRQTMVLEPLAPSMWAQLVAWSASLSLLLLLSGGLSIWVARGLDDLKVVRGYSLFTTAFWTVAFVLYATAEPVALPLVAAFFAVPLHGTAYLAAERATPAG